MYNLIKFMGNMIDLYLVNKEHNLIVFSVQNISANLNDFGELMLIFMWIFYCQKLLHI